MQNWLPYRSALRCSDKFGYFCTKGDSLIFIAQLRTSMFYLDLEVQSPS
jgi:hypothetical protein